MDKPSGSEKDKAVDDFAKGFLLVLGLGLCIFVPLFFSSEKWFEPYFLPVFWAGLIVLAVSILVVIESAQAFQSLSKFTSVKVGISLMFAAVLLVSGANASHAINEIFGVSSASFPYTLAFVTASEFFALLKPLFMVFVALASVSIVLGFAYQFRNDEAPWSGMAWMVVVASLLVGGYGWFITAKVLDSNSLDLKIYKMAHALDFQRSHSCSGLSADNSVVFLGAKQDRVLVDKPQTFDLSPRGFFFDTDRDWVDIPEKFNIVACS